jgi:predicted ester cyclase
MSTETNKALIRRIFEEGMNGNRPEVYDETIAPDYVNYDFPAPAPGREGFKIVTAMFQAAFPDMRTVLEDEIAEGDKVVTRGYFTGTHKGEFMGIPPTGKTIKVGYIDIWRVANGRGKDNWVQMDMLGLMQQLGVIPAPEQAAR